jgi:hypothetical protein
VLRVESRQDKILSPEASGITVAYGGFSISFFDGGSRPMPE